MSTLCQEKPNLCLWQRSSLTTNTKSYHGCHHFCDCQARRILHGGTEENVHYLSLFSNYGKSVTWENGFMTCNIKSREDAEDYVRCWVGQTFSSIRVCVGGSIQGVNPTINPLPSFLFCSSPLLLLSCFTFALKSFLS